MPMNHEGILFMGKVAARADFTSKGDFRLLVPLLDKDGPRYQSRYLITWTGEEARAFWQQYAAQLNPGAVVKVRLKYLNARFTHRDIPPDLTAQAQHIEIVPKTTIGGQEIKP